MRFFSGFGRRQSREYELLHLGALCPFDSSRELHLFDPIRSDDNVRLVFPLIFSILDHNRAKAQIASRLKVSPDSVKNIIIWGNHSSTQFPDVRSATVNVNGKDTSVFDAVQDDHWLKNDFVAVRESIETSRLVSFLVDCSKTWCCSDCSTQTIQCHVCSESHLWSHAQLVARN